MKSITNTMYYKNKFGQLKIEIIGPYQDVSKMHSNDFDDHCFFTIEDAEKVALITGNKDTQLSFSVDKNGKYRAYLVRHQSSSIAALCRILNLHFDENINAQQTLGEYGYAL